MLSPKFAVPSDGKVLKNKKHILIIFIIFLYFSVGFRGLFSKVCVEGSERFAKYIVRDLSEITRGGGGGNFEFGFGNEVTDPCNGSEIC